MKKMIEKFIGKIQRIYDIDHVKASNIDEAEYLVQIQYNYHGMFVS
jgi:hypothetical protein